ncbi:hypothetical protein ABLN87_21140 [Ruegeria sp. SCPT10]
MDLSRKKPVLKNRVPEHVEKAVIELAIENPALGQKRASWELQQQGIVVSSSGVRSIWLRTEVVLRFGPVCSQLKMDQGCI